MQLIPKTTKRIVFVAAGIFAYTIYVKMGLMKRLNEVLKT